MMCNRNIESDIGTVRVWRSPNSKQSFRLTPKLSTQSTSI